MRAETENNAIGHTVRKERRRLLDFIRHRVASDADAEDILQDVFFQFIAAMQLEPIERTASWLFQVAGNKIIDWYRKRKNFSLDEKFSRSDDEENFLPEEILFGDTDTPEEIYFRSTVWPIIEEALAELPDEQREVFMMHEIEEKSFKEISDLTGAPVNTLLSRKRYAVLYLRERLRDLYEEFFDL